MTNYKISKSLNKNRVFILQKNELEKRLDPFYYVPELVELEKKVLAKRPKRLRDYVNNIASGATPKTVEVEKYYAEKESGIPFLRVQNLSPTGVLKFDNCKYINNKTHSGMLKRSQVLEGDLLVKITGVGRMAVASVAPKNFEGNINQHVCVIKTGSIEVSETLASFLNSDVGEKLASRRSTGGTRPALDYPALLSIPIIEDKRLLEITQKVVEFKKQNEAKANKLLSSIDDYLLGELGIKLPEPPGNNLKNRMFTTSLKDISGGRFDPFYNQEVFKQLNTVLDNDTFIRFSNLIKEITKGETPLWKGESYMEKGVPFLKVQNISTSGIYGKLTYIANDLHNSMLRSKLKGGELLYTMAGSIGIATFLPENFGQANINQAIAKIILKEDILINKIYLVETLNSYICKIQAKRFLTVAAQPNINFDQIKAIRIPLPPLEKQKETADHITAIRAEAQQLKEKTLEALKQANKEIEKILLN